MAMITSSPNTIFCQKPSTAITFMPFWITVIRPTPRIVRSTFPFPPVSMIPPRTEDAMAISVYCSPTVGIPLFNFTAKKIPPRAAVSPDMVNATIFAFTTSNPISLAARSFVPRASIVLPSAILF